jgi:hypothetical protein
MVFDERTEELLLHDWDRDLERPIILKSPQMAKALCDYRKLCFKGWHSPCFEYETNIDHIMYGVARLNGFDDDSPEWKADRLSLYAIMTRMARLERLNITYCSDRLKTQCNGKYYHDMLDTIKGDLPLDTTKAKQLRQQNLDKLTDIEKRIFERPIEMNNFVQDFYKILFFFNPYTQQQGGPTHIQWEVYQALRSMNAD